MGGIREFATGASRDTDAGKLDLEGFLSPLVLERLVLQREPTVLTLKDLCSTAELPWVDQPGRVFD